MYGRLETCGRLSIGLSGLRRTLILSVAYALRRAVSGILPTLRSRVSTNRRVPPRFLDLVVQALARDRSRKRNSANGSVILPLGPCPLGTLHAPRCDPYRHVRLALPPLERSVLSREAA